MKRIIFSLISLIVAYSASAGSNGFEKRIFVYEGDTLQYNVLFPENYDKSRTYPLVLFLHGAGERGNDNQKQLTHGASLFLNSENLKDYPSIVIFPQCPEAEYWVKFNKVKFDFGKKPEISKPLFLVKKLMDGFKKTEAVDKKKIYVLGLSMGGMATFDLICRYPKYFAAAIPICGGVNTSRLKAVRKMPIRIFHGGADTVVSCEFSRNAFIELKAEGSQRVEYVEFPGVGHDSWTNAFNYPDFMSWLYYQTR